MPHQQITINQLTNIEATDYLNLNARECARRMRIGKDKVYASYCLFQKGLSVEAIYSQYKQNNCRCGRKPVMLSTRKLDSIQDALDQGWLLDTIVGRDKLMNHEKRVSTKILYKFVKNDTKKVKINQRIIKKHAAKLINGRRMNTILNPKRVKDMDTLKGIRLSVKIVNQLW